MDQIVNFVLHESLVLLRLHGIIHHVHRFVQVGRIFLHVADLSHPDDGEGSYAVLPELQSLLQELYELV